jgi:hypothetical protein
MPCRGYPVVGDLELAQGKLPVISTLPWHNFAAEKPSGGPVTQAFLSHTETPYQGHQRSPPSCRTAARSAGPINCKMPAEQGDLFDGRTPEPGIPSD